MLKHCLIVFLVSMVPVIELRGAIPYGVGFGLPLWLTYCVAIAGNMLPDAFGRFVRGIYEAVPQTKDVRFGVSCSDALSMADACAVSALAAGARASQAKHIDPLSEDDPSGSQVSHTITKTAMAVVIGILVLIVGMQIGYGVMRRLNTANLSESVSVDTVSTALKGGLEWGNGFTQFPLDFTVDEADERAGTVEVTVLDTSSANELELLSNGQIQAAALATNALLNDKIDRVVYNVHAYINEDSRIQHDSFFGMFPARGHQSAILTFVWTKSSSNATSIDWKMRIVSMDDTIAERIQKQVNSVSSLIEDPVVSQTKIDEEKAERDLEHRLHGREIFRGGKPDRTPSELLEQDKQK